MYRPTSELRARVSDALVGHGSWDLGLSMAAVCSGGGKIDETVATSCTERPVAGPKSGSTAGVVGWCQANGETQRRERVGQGKTVEKFSCANKQMF